jgi:hypothetical protein
MKIVYDGGSVDVFTLDQLYTGMHCLEKLRNPRHRCSRYCNTLASGRRPRDWHVLTHRCEFWKEDGRFIVTAHPGTDDDGKLRSSHMRELESLRVLFAARCEITELGSIRLEGKVKP